MTHGPRFYVDNLLGKLDATLAVANSAMGGTHPPDTLIQLIPTDARRQPVLALLALAKIGVDLEPGEILT